MKFKTMELLDEAATVTDLKNAVRDLRCQVQAGTDIVLNKLKELPVVVLATPALAVVEAPGPAPINPAPSIWLSANTGSVVDPATVRQVYTPPSEPKAPAVPDELRCFRAPPRRFVPTPKPATKPRMSPAGRRQLDKLAALAGLGL